MSRLLLAAAVAGGVLASVGKARAEDYHRFAPHATSVTWPSVTPPGWYTDTYAYRWYYPWYAYYDYTHGPYANWMAGGGYAGYANHGPAGMYYSCKPPAQPYLGEWYYRMQEQNAQKAQIDAPKMGPNNGQLPPSSFSTLQDLTGKPLSPPRQMAPPSK